MPSKSVMAPTTTMSRVTRTRPRSAIVLRGHIRICAGQIERIVQIAGRVACERHAAGYAGCFVVPRDLQIVEPVGRFEDGSRESGLDVPFYVAVDCGKVWVSLGLAERPEGKAWQ